ncbi:hypothetical protein [Gordonibacter massiliensis (ex Traore et al. 2017)]|uniref:hypothetical protein n=1 Tax=Gordonibacter massiliensis (ex Traore et al. 2017) TaxID=1841863 RepID=UPI001C8BFFB1|nr:hypothetical protein [Gordonibacter massiliensis (ex Traore et al. 2017)]MBX9033816.1 hypothetical protein [Gordonibacter massiliensis (ex Traore et al. 2017)]
MCYVCSMCNACGKVDRLREMNAVCPACGKPRDVTDGTCPHCGHQRPPYPGPAGTRYAGEAAASMRTEGT